MAIHVCVVHPESNLNIFKCLTNHCTVFSLYLFTCMTRTFILYQLFGWYRFKVLIKLYYVSVIVMDLLFDGLLRHPANLHIP